MTTSGVADGPLGKVYTLPEAVAYLRSTTRVVLRVARANGLYSKSGQDILFSESDVLAIWDAMRCPSESSPEKGVRTSTSGARSADKAFSRVLEQATRKSRSRSASKPKRAS